MGLLFSHRFGVPLGSGDSRFQDPFQVGHGSLVQTEGSLHALHGFGFSSNSGGLGLGGSGGLGFSGSGGVQGARSCLLAEGPGESTAKVVLPVSPFLKHGTGFVAILGVSFVPV